MTENSHSRGAFDLGATAAALAGRGRNGCRLGRGLLDRALDRLLRAVSHSPGCAHLVRGRRGWASLRVVDHLRPWHTEGAVYFVSARPAIYRLLSQLRQPSAPRLAVRTSHHLLGAGGLRALDGGLTWRSCTRLAHRCPVHGAG